MQSGRLRLGWHLLLCLLFGGLISSALGAQSASVSWNASTSYGVTGYILYYGTASGVYTYTNNNGLATNITVMNLQVGTTYYFVVTAFNASGYESYPSSQVSYTVSNSVPTSPVITWSNPANLVYGTPLGVNQLDATANVPGSFVYSPPAGVVLPAGNAQALSAIFTPMDTTNYSVAATTVTVNILVAPLTITANNNSKVFGTALPTLTASYSGFVNGDTVASLGTAVILSTTALASSSVGAYTITASGAVSVNYSITDFDGVLTISQALASGVVGSSANPSLLGTNVTFTMTLSAVAPGAGTPSGTVNFLIDGGLAASGAMSGGVATLTTNYLALGLHTVAAEYAGDLNFVGTTNALAQEQFVDTPPVTVNVTIERYPSQGVKVFAATLLANDTDPDSNALTFISVSATSMSGGTNVLQGNWVFYQPPSGFTNSDSFSYVIRDSSGLQATGSVSVATEADLNPSQNVVAIVDLGGNDFSIQFLGIPVRVYTIQYTTNLVTPSWQPLGAGTADATGSFSYIDMLDQGSPPRFYRSTYP
jgi:hypothetical protein